MTKLHHWLKPFSGLKEPKPPIYSAKRMGRQAEEALRKRGDPTVNARTAHRIAAIRRKLAEEQLQEMEDDNGLDQDS